ncbi:MAG: hypothetical protein EOO70_04115 [Myxococcaceae bacterium]|nr:MAG: hypothetical protein EOO70_04115 [Myxococcaceae bacterium]
MSRQAEISAKLAAMAGGAVTNAWNEQKSWVYIVDEFMKELAPHLRSEARTPDELIALEVKVRHEVTRQLVTEARTRLSTASDDAEPSVKRRVEAEIENLQRHEDYLAALLRHTESLTEARRNRWVPRAALVIASASLLWQIIAALWHLK